jgi:BMFP domain-containing protein YqiC
METIIFDTHAFVKRLTAVGFREDQAEVLASTQAQLISEQLVTREHFDFRIKELELKLEARIAEVEIKIAETKADIIKWNVGSVFASVGLFAAMVKLIG